MTSTAFRLCPKLAFLFLFLMAFATAGRAMTVVMPTDDDMIVGARGIVVGRVVSTSAGLDDKTGFVCTYVRLSVSQVLKGDLTPGVVVLKEPGGMVGTRGSVVFGTPLFARGERVLLYLDSWWDGSLRVHDMFLGKFSIAKDPATGQWFADRGTEGAHIEVLPDSTPGHDQSHGAITSRMELETYLAMVRARLVVTRTRSKEFEARYYTGVPMLTQPAEYVAKLKTGDLEPQFHTFNPPSRYFEPDTGQPVVFQVNPDGAPVGQVLDDVAAAMRAWSTVPGSSLVVTSGGTTSTCKQFGSPSQIYFNNCDGFFSPDPGCSAIVGIGGFLTLDGGHTEVINGTTFVRIVRSFASINPYASCFFDHCGIQEVITHELGHALGLQHPWDPTFPGSPTGSDLAATMYFIAHFDGRCASLKSDDINAIKFIYPGTGTGAGGGPVAVTSFSPLPIAYPGQQFSVILQATGGTIPYTWTVTAGSVPPGLTFTPDGFIYGRATTPGTFNFTVLLSDANSQTQQADFSMTVNSGSPPTDGAQFVTQSVPSRVNAGQSFNVTQVWNNVGIETWSDNAGVMLGTQDPANNRIWGGNSEGLSGANIMPTRQLQMSFTVVAPSTPGTYNFQWQWLKQGLYFGDLSAPVTIAVIQPAPPLDVATSAIPDGSLGTPYQQQLSATGGIPPYAWSISQGALPAGLSVDTSTGLIHGTPSAGGDANFTVRVVDSQATSTEKPFSLRIISQPLTITPSTVPVAVTGSAYSLQLAGSGGLPPYTWAVSAGALPGGLSIDPATGLISGIPTAKGNFDLTISLHDQLSAITSVPLALLVVGPESVPHVGKIKYKKPPRKLMVNGQNFDAAAVLLVDGGQIAARVEGATFILAKPVTLASGQHTVQVVNPQNIASNVVVLTVN
ncbi:MAG TPA: putative Ig domain-containing protein [Blastocatellia bacterium]|nr:putative Ig domain-containing protein [Blastocatellia bacterium]